MVIQALVSPVSNPSAKIGAPMFREKTRTCPASSAVASFPGPPRLGAAAVGWRMGFDEPEVQFTLKVTSPSLKKRTIWLAAATPALMFASAV